MVILSFFASGKTPISPPAAGRPPHYAAYDFSFPSGHSTAAFIFYGLLIYLLWSSRLQTGVKYILSGSLSFCVGFAWLSLSFLLYSK